MIHVPYLFQLKDLAYKYQAFYLSNEPGKYLNMPNSFTIDRFNRYNLVLFICSFQKCWCLSRKVDCLKIERRIREDLPEDIDVQTEIPDWLVLSWNRQFRQSA